MTRTLALCLAALAILPTGCAVDTADAATSGPILDAPVVRTHPSVVAVSSVRGDETSLCTGIVVGPYAVLTLAECVELGAAAASVIADDDARFGVRLAVDAVAVDPADPRLAMLVMQEPLMSEEAFVASEPTGSQTVTAVGYGLSGGASILGVKRAAQYRVEGQALVAENHSLCMGDLGAAIFDARGHVVGIVSRVMDSACVPGTRDARWIPLVEHMPFIDAGADMYPTCADPLGC